MGKDRIMFDGGMNKTIDWYLANERWLKNVVSGSYQKYYDDIYSGS